MSCSLASHWANNGPKYLIMVAWLGVNAYLMWHTYMEYKHSPQYFYLHQILGAGLCWSRGTAAMINLNLGVLLLPMCRTTMTLIRGSGCKVPMRTVRTLIDQCKGFHILCCYILVVASVVHFFGHCFNADNYSEHYFVIFTAVNAARKPKESPLLIVFRSVPGVTGVLLLVLLSMIVSSAVYAVRSACYDVFWYVHRLSFVFYLLVLVHATRGILKRQVNISRHTPGCVYINSTDPWPESEPEPEIPREQWSCVEDPIFDTIGCSTWLWTIVPLCVYVCDLIYRTINRHHHTAIMTGFNIKQEEILEIQIRKEGFNCRPGQYVLLQSPHISSFEWHPYTISKVPVSKNAGEFSVHIKTTGDWSVKLRDHLLDKKNTAAYSDILLENNHSHSLYVDGPFASPMEDILRYNVAVCIAGGIGITPFIAMLNYIRTEYHPRLRRLYLIWMCRDVRPYLCFANILCDTYIKFWNKNRPDVFNIQLFVTETSHPLKPDLLQEYSILQRRIFFGRPKWSSVMCKIAAAFPGDTVGVFCCGPKSLSTEVSSHCMKTNNGGTKFHFHHESF